VYRTDDEDVPLVIVPHAGLRAGMPMDNPADGRLKGGSGADQVRRDQLRG
jgi:hypothetical protein